LSNSYWPLVWPSPEPVTLELDCRAASLTLPVRPVREEVLRDFGPPQGSKPSKRTVLRPASNDWYLHHNLGTDEHMLEVVDDSGRTLLDDIGLETELKATERYSAVGDDPTSARGEVVTERTLARDDWKIASLTTTVLSTTATHFVVDAELVASENGREVFRREWHEEIPRDLV
jgi:uncharacterized protein